MPRHHDLSFRVLGPLEVDAGAGPLPLGGPKQRAVLGALLLRANQVVPADTLIDEVWGEEPPEKARNSLHTYVSNLRRAIGEERLQGRPPGYLLVVRPAELDASRFDALLRDARTALPIDPGVAVATLDDALALWRGPALADLAAQPSFLAEAARLDDLRLQAQEARIEGMLAAGAAGRAVGEIEALLAHHPLRESLWGRLMLALYRDGRQADALQAYQRAREVLTDELGIEPSQELRRLQERILQQDARLDLRGEPLRGYRLLEQIGEGPSSLAFRAIQPHVERDVAVRIVRESLAGDSDFARRFESDAQAVAALEHPHIVPVYDYWREPGRAYVVSRYLRGGSLADLEARGGALDAELAQRVVDQVAAALAFAHRQGIVHGRVRPSNVLLDSDGNAYLGDFPTGVAAPADPAIDRRHLADLARRLLGDAAREPAAEAPGAAGEAAVLADTRNPYKGLRPFGEADAGDFFGRGDLVRRMVGRLREPVPGARFLAVVGPSGGGKSSAVRAGLVPALRGDVLELGAPPFVVEMQPGPHPVAELEAALIRLAVRPVSRLYDLLDAGTRGLLDAVDLVLPPGAEAVLVVDQLEEVFTLARDPAEQALFLEALRVAAVDPASRLRVIVTLRADFYDRPLTHPRFGELLAGRTEALPPLTPDEQEQAIREPAARVGVRPERGLVAELLADVAHQPGALPLLQFTLTELFERRSGDRLTREAFREIGGVGGALSARAERIHAGLDADGQEATRQVFLRLVELGEGRPDTRRRVPLAELDVLDQDPETIAAVLDRYGRHRLLTFDREPGTREPTVEVAHEAILTAWGRLRAWIDGARDDLRQHRHLARSAAEWRAAGRDPSFLLTGSRLDAAEVWVPEASLTVAAEEREYLAESARRRDRQLAAERRSRTLLRGLAAVLAVASAVAVALALVAQRNSDQAEHEATIATARELAGAAMGSLQSDPERSLLLALEAVETTRRSGDEALPEAQEALHQAVIGSRLVATFDANGGSAALSPDGVLAVRSAGAPGSVDLREVASGRLIRTFAAHGRPVGDLAFTADGSLLATTGEDGRLRVWNTATGTLVAELRRRGAAGSPSFSRDGTRVAASWDDESAVVMDAASGEVLGRLRGVGWSHPIDLSPAGDRAVYSHGPGAVIADVSTGRVTRRLAGQFPANDVAWSPDGRRVAVVSNGGAGEIWDARTGRRTLILPHRGIILAVAWAPDSSHLVTGALDGTARVWETHEDDVAEVARLSAQDTSSGIAVVGFSASGEQAYTVDARRSAAKLWAVGRSGEAEWANLPAAGFLGDVEYLPDGRLAASIGDGGVTIWDAGMTRRTQTVGRGIQGWPWFGVSPDGSTVAVGGGRLAAWDIASGRRLFDLAEFDLADGPTWSPDSRYVASTRSGRTVGIVDRKGRTVKLLAVPAGGWGPLIAQFSPDGRVLAVAAQRSETEGAVLLWDWRSGKLVRRIDGLAGSIDFDPTGSRIVVANGHEQAAIYDVATGRRLAGLPGHTSMIIDVAFSPDGTRVATAGFNDAVRVFDADDGHPLLTLHSPEAAVSEVAFSPDGRRLAAFSPDVGGDGVGTVRVWALDVDDLVRIARSKVTRGLTGDECRRFLHRATCPAG